MMINKAKTTTITTATALLLVLLLHAAAATAACDDADAEFLAGSGGTAGCGDDTPDSRSGFICNFPWKT